MKDLERKGERDERVREIMIQKKRVKERGREEGKRERTRERVTKKRDNEREKEDNGKGERKKMEIKNGNRE